KVAYANTVPWPPEADGFGLSLQRRDVSQYGNDPINWVAAPPTTAAATSAGGTPPSISQQPQDQAGVAATDASMSVSASGTGPLNYQWRLNGANLDGETNSVLPLNNLRLEQIGVYQVVVFNTAGSV